MSMLVGKWHSSNLKRPHARERPADGTRRAVYFQVDTRGPGFLGAQRLCACVERAKMREGLALVRWVVEGALANLR